MRKISDDDFISELVQKTVKEIYGQSADIKETTGLALSFLARFTGILLYKSLSDDVPRRLRKKEDKAAYTIKTFSATKVAVQESVAAAFTGALQMYSGMPVEYYCQVRTVGSAANKEPI